jgi:hypothetical protein
VRGRASLPRGTPRLPRGRARQAGCGAGCSTCTIVNAYSSHLCSSRDKAQYIYFRYLYAEI